MLTGYLERDHLMGLCWHTFKKYADRLFRKRSSHGPMLAYLMLHLQVGIRTQTRTEIAILMLMNVNCEQIIRGLKSDIFD